MKEEFLHYLWKYSLYNADSLIDNEGNRITVIHPGEYNRDSGPDFFNARICIAGTEWAGNVEIHTKASHFDVHGHNKDHAFDNVILHVVAENDRKIFNARGEELLTIVIGYDTVYFEKYQDLINNPAVIACQNDIRYLDNFYVRHWLHSLLIERLQKKAEAVMNIFRETGNDWEETFYRVLSRYFGFRVNTGPFEMLASALPFKIIRKHADNRLQVEALLFGTAGMLDEKLFREALSDSYYKDLIREYKILSAKYSLKPIHGWLWKFSRLRPVNFPTLRISQLSALVSVAGGLFSRTLEAADVKQLKELFEVSASPYWDDHYIFGKKSIRIPKNTGMQAMDIFLINAVIPLIFVYGQSKESREICEKALTFLESIHPEDNTVIADWKLTGVEAESAFYTQALIQLTDEYCRKRRCLECRIGCKLISLGKSFINSNELMLEP
ncbi:MAG: DUF2851 family protein [Bacteroidales bacterium]